MKKGKKSTTSPGTSDDEKPDSVAKEPKTSPRPNTAPANLQGAPVRYHISTTVKSIEGDCVRDHSLAEILSRSSLRPDLREADTPLTTSKTKGKPRPGGNFPHGRTQLSPESEKVFFNADSIATPHTYAKVTQPGTPRKSMIASKVLAFLRKSWDNYTSQFDFRANGQQAPQSFAQDIIHLCTEAVKVFEAEPMYLNLPSNIFVIGDIHGNYADLQYFMSELLLFGDIEITPYSFLALGDYVDRGEHSVECVALCLALKCLSPHTFNMLRGNHEMNEYGFGRNDRGNCIITFSEVAVDNFLSANGLELMFRAHQEKSDGLKLSKSAKCLTIFSSSNYQGHGNGAGVVYVGSSGKIKLILKDPS